MPKGHKTIWTRELDLLIRRHASTAAAARATGLGYDTVKYRRRYLGLPRRKSGPEPGPTASTLEIIRLLRAGMSGSKIARRMNVSRQRVSEIKKKYYAP